MYDQDVFVQVVSEYIRTLARHQEVYEALSELPLGVTKVLHLAGSGVSVGVGDELRWVTASPQRVMLLEQAMEEPRSGPCMLAYRSGELMMMDDIARQAERWPAFRASAASARVGSVAGVPIRLDEKTLGVLSLYRDDVGQWSRHDLAAARVLADMAAAFLTNASTYRRQDELADQLQRALNTRVVIEQAKGMLAGEQQIGVDQAFHKVRRYARSHNVTVHKVADAVVNLGLRV